MPSVAVLDDYQGCALQMADWTSLSGQNKIHVFRNHLSADALIERLKDFEIVVAMRERTPFPRNVLERLPRLQLLVTTGLRNASIDMQAASDCDILVCGTDGLSYPTAELTWGLILALARNIPQEDSATRKGRWQVSMGIGLQGKVLGIIGLGRVGAQVATIGQAFRMKVLAWSQNLTAERARQQGTTLASKEELLSRADIITIHLVLSARTLGLIGESEFRLMKRTAYLVNTSRGPIVDEKALVQAIRKKKIAGAAMDVFNEEPLPLTHPLRHLENTIITPHIGYVTVEGYRVFYEQALEDIEAFLKGSPIRVLNKS